MRILYTQCGLGNQLFQYAYLKFLESRGCKNLWIDHSAPSLRTHQGFELPYVFPQVAKTNRFLSPVIGRILHLLSDIPKKIFHCSLETDSEETNFTSLSPRILWLRGYWQNAFFPESVSLTLRNDLKFRPIDDPLNAELATRIKASNSVSIHLRGGDYLNTSFNVCTPDYYRQAIKLIQDQIENPCFFVFSNDIPWAKETLGLTDAQYINNNQGENSFRDMQLMSMCNHNIIANSSFSWWAAWLNQNQEKMVIAPSPWFKHCDNKFNQQILPSAWVKILV